jgi:Flp pilus assembly protein TadG
MNTAAFRENSKGTATIEFALVFPMFLTLLIGGFFCAFLLFTAGGLHYAVERAARCASVQTSVCSDATSTQDYALAQFSGYGVTPTFTATSAACGQQVTGSTNFSFNFFVRTVAVPLSATACYP